MSSNGGVTLAVAATLSLALSACASTVVRSGLPPGRTAPGYDGRWQAAFLFGAIPGRNAHDLDALCPNGWAELHVEADEFTFAAGLLTAFLYSPSRLTVVCAARDAETPPTLGSYPPPTRAEAPAADVE